jgi:hypothetical protein
MGRASSSASVSLDDLLRLAIPEFKRSQNTLPAIPRRGAPPRYPDWALAALILAAILRKKKSKSAQYRYLVEHRATLLSRIGLRRMPSRATYCRRYRTLATLAADALRRHGRGLIRTGIVQAREVVADKSLIAANGPPWHQRDRRKGRCKRGVDPEAGWGYSEHDGWVYGYSYEVVVTATPRSPVVPLLASVGPANTSEIKSLEQKVPDLPAATRFLSCDAGYDSNPLAERVEEGPDGRRTGRRFLCPLIPRRGKAKNRKRKHHPLTISPNTHESPERRTSRLKRAARYQFFTSPRGRQIYRRRKQTVEPFNQWFKSLFELHHHTWHRGLANNQTHQLLALFAYQLLVRINHRHGHANDCIAAILDKL